MNLFVNFLLYQLGWLAAVIGAAQQLPWLGPLAMLIVVAWHLYRSRYPQPELMLVVVCACIGAVFDSVLVAFNWVSYPSGLFSDSMAPYWIISMWMMFATTLNVSMRWLKGRPLLAVVLGAIAGPLAYLAGQKLGGIIFVDSQAALLSLAAGWGVMMPVLMSLAERFNGFGEDSPARTRDVAMEVG